MVTIVNTHAAKTHMSSLIDRAIAGEEIVIARSGKPMVKLVPVEDPEEPWVPPWGSMKDKIKILPGFFDPLPDDILDLIEGPIEADLEDEPLASPAPE
ncbi:MAG: type II toxin-antitoxin system prevent-host-death family antitoxin [Chloroflexi bacterium]|nr:type II toxin-antitoxin system prevent-host-death family antitoxin [Chloroflexota bacterium]